MTESGGAYLTSKDGILRMVIIVFGIISFSLVTAAYNGAPRGAVAWSFAAFLMSWILSLFFFILILTNLASKMDCGVSFEAVDYCFSLILFVFCLSGSIVLSIYTWRYCGECIAGDIFGFLTAILYFVELFFHKGDAPAPTQYVTTTNGIIKVVVVTLGCIAFALLEAGGYRCGSDDPCTSGRTFAFAAFIISWTVSTIFLLIYITGLSEKIGNAVQTADFAWAVFSVIFYLTASIVLACYLDGPGTNSRRLAADIFGFFTTLAYLVEAIMLKKSSGQQLIVPSK